MLLNKSHVYVLVHKDKKYLKIGKANVLEDRVSSLERSWGGFDKKESFAYIVPERSVIRLEKFLHEFFSNDRYYNLPKKDGYTEMFNISILPALKDLLKKMAAVKSKFEMEKRTLTKFISNEKVSQGLIDLEKNKKAFIGLKDISIEARILIRSIFSKIYETKNPDFSMRFGKEKLLVSLELNKDPSYFEFLENELREANVKSLNSNEKVHFFKYVKTDRAYIELKVNKDFLFFLKSEISKFTYLLEEELFLNGLKHILRFPIDIRKSKYYPLSMHKDYTLIKSILSKIQEHNGRVELGFYRFEGKLSNYHTKEQLDTLEENLCNLRYFDLDRRLQPLFTVYSLRVNWYAKTIVADLRMSNLSQDFTYYSTFKKRLAMRLETVHFMTPEDISETEII